MAIGNVVEVKLKFTLAEAGKPKKFELVLICQRLDQEEIDAQIKEQEGKPSLVPFIERVATGWRDQTLVLEEDDQPAAFGPEALKELLKVRGLDVLAFNRYLQEVGAKEKNS
ncbi:MAG TPA: hypothetical protein VLK85_20025 [Ramlibacter sp.]|nr:hypothetical protein [Ramlibacter sp.]